MKKALPTSIAALFLATGMANAQNARRGVCMWSITMGCAAIRNGGSYTREHITYKFAGVKPNGRFRFHVYVGNTRVK
jgi:hypothetical protein